MADSGWEHFEHQADIGLLGWGAEPARAFEQTALALTAVVAALETVRAERRVPIECSAPALDLLLVDWLNALVFEMGTRNMLFGRFRVAIETLGAGYRLRGEAWGEPIDRARHEPAVEVKGATYTALAVEQAPGGSWRAQCVVDV